MSAFDGTYGPTLKIQFYFNGAWTNVPTADLREIDIYRGRPRPDQRIDAGTMTAILDNHSGDYDPDNLSGPWVISGVTALRDGLRARFIATWNGTGYTLFDGYLETTYADGGFDATATMTFVDAIARFGKYTAKAYATPSFANETTATRVGRMLTYANWPTGSSWRSLTGSVTLQKTAQNLPILDMIDQCVQAESGAFYMSRTGVATFINLQNKFSRPTQLEFSDVRDPSKFVEYYEINTAPGTLQVVNTAFVNRLFGAAQQFYSNKASVSKYGYKAVTVNAPIAKDSVAYKLAAYLGSKNATPQTLVREIRFTALNLDVLYPDFLETELLDMCLVNRTTVDGRTQQYKLVIEGMQHRITANDWDVTYMTSATNAARVILP